MVDRSGTLLTTEYKILDATCSFSKIWPKHATIRIDKRPECKPDIVMDATDLKFPDNYFDEIYCDPPHLIRKSDNLNNLIMARRRSGRTSPDPFTRYGYWHNHQEFYDFVEKTNNEFCRCLKPSGVLYYKMTDATGCVKTSDLIERMTNFELIKDETKQVKSNLGKGKTRWLTFKVKLTEVDSDTYDGAN